MNDMDEIVIDKILQDEMKSRGITLNRLAKDCQIPASVLHGWINGRLPSAKNLILIKNLANYLEISIEHLIFGIRPNISERRILYSATFVDEGIKYRFSVEKIK